MMLLPVGLQVKRNPYSFGNKRIIFSKLTIIGLKFFQTLLLRVPLCNEPSAIL
jgi:hypothetical protein